MPAADGRDTEISALEAVIQALEPLDDDARGRVLDYALRRLGMSELPPIDPPPVTGLEIIPPPAAAPPATVTDIRTLRTQKNPSSANEMAALAAYYLSELAPSSDRKDSVATADIEPLFKQAGFPLPSRIAMTLPNAAAAGYFDKALQGGYKLNPVGFNLVTQSLPRGSAAPVKRSPSRKPTSSRKPGAARKTTSPRRTTTPKRKPKKK